jgi:hypothetical protein
LPRRAVLEAGLRGARGGGVGEDLYVGKFGEAAQTGGMIAMFVGEEDRIDAAERLPMRGEQLAQTPGGKAGVHEHTRGIGLEQGAIARAAAAENAKSHGHCRYSMARGARRNGFLCPISRRQLAATAKFYLKYCGQHSGITFSQ